MEIWGQGAEFFIARHKSNYEGNGWFKNAYRFDEDMKLVKVGRVKADAVYNKGAFPYDDVPALNNLRVQNFVKGKRKTYEALPEITPSSVVVSSEAAYMRALDNYDNNEMVVIKPNVGACGRGVVIQEKEKLVEDIPDGIEDGYIVQDFLDSSIGIKGIVDGIHDFRITLNNGRHVSTLLRTPKAGGLVSNFALGGHMEVLHPDETPRRFVDLAKEIDKELFKKKAENRNLAFDFANTKKGIRLIEINDSVGLDIWDDAPHVRDCHRILAETLVEMGG
jgi:glutathione synthase/RimK-type ligase-like ATP-grasp enzyme